MRALGSTRTSVQFSCSVVSRSLWPHELQASLSIATSWSSLKLMSIESVLPSSHLILCHPLLLLPSIFPSLRVFSNESVLCIRWPKYGSFSFSISPSSEYSGLISFRMDWFDLLVAQGTLKTLLQHHSSKASVLQRSAFFIVQLSQNLTFLKPWTNQCFFLMEIFVLSYVNEPCIYSRLCLLVGTA